MSVTILKDEKLEKHYKVVVPAKTLEKEIDAEIISIAPTIKMQGFRPGKVPVSFVKKRYGSSIRSDAINKQVRSSVEKILKEKELRPTSSPRIEDVVTKEGKDLEFTIKMELFPEMNVPDFKKAKIQKPVVKPSDKDLEEHIGNVAKDNLVYTKESKTNIVKDDQATIDFVGYLKGKAFDGGAMNGHKLVIGSGSFIPGFEDQLIGSKAGDDVTIKVTFPEAYHSKELAGQEAEFKVKIHAVHKPEESKIDDAFAKSLGLKDLEDFKKRSLDMLARAFDGEILTNMKMHLFDFLEKELTFDVPDSMLEREYEMIKAQANSAEEGDSKDKKESKKMEDSYRRIALRRVRIGLLLADYAEKNKLNLTQDDIKNALLAQARMFPGQEQMIIDYYTRNPNAIESLKGPIIEDKAVKAILSNEVDVKEKVYSVKEIRDFFKEENDREID